MSGPKTLDDLITGWCKEASLGSGLLEAPVFWGLVEKHAKHYHIIPGADAMVTPQGLGDAAKAIGRLYGWELPASMKCPTHLVDRFRVFARAALEAAGMVVVEVVGEFDDPEGGGPMLWDGKEWHAIGDGDRVAIIKRATTVSHSKEE